MAKIEAEPKLDNRNMIMVLAPDKRARQAAASRSANQHRGDEGAVTRFGAETADERQHAGHRGDRDGNHRRGMTQCRR